MTTKTDVLRDTLLALLGTLILAGLLFGCGDTDSPTAPSSAPSSAPPIAMADALSPAPSFDPSTPARTMPASFDLRPKHAGFNAYDFVAGTEDHHLRIGFVPLDMADGSMREASGSWRGRDIAIYLCSVEPHTTAQNHIQNQCALLWDNKGREAGHPDRKLTRDLDVRIPLRECAGWIVVNAAELTDDKDNGWRNAPCPTEGRTSVSDGTILDANNEMSTWVDDAREDPNRTDPTASEAAQCA